MERDKVVTFRMTRKEYELLQAGARADDRPVSAYIRLHVLARALLDTKRIEVVTP